MVEMSSELVPFYSDEQVSIYNGDSLETLRKLPEKIIQVIITSPPY